MNVSEIGLYCRLSIIQPFTGINPTQTSRSHFWSSQTWMEMVWACSGKINTFPPLMCIIQTQPVACWCQNLAIMTYENGSEMSLRPSDLLVHIYQTHWHMALSLSAGSLSMLSVWTTPIRWSAVITWAMPLTYWSRRKTLASCPERWGFIILVQSTFSYLV